MAGNCAIDTIAWARTINCQRKHAHAQLRVLMKSAQAKSNTYAFYFIIPTKVGLAAQPHAHALHTHTRAHTLTRHIKSLRTTNRTHTLGEDMWGDCRTKMIIIIIIFSGRHTSIAFKRNHRAQENLNGPQTKMRTFYGRHVCWRTASGKRQRK